MKRRNNLPKKRQTSDKMSVTNQAMCTEIIHDDSCRDFEDLLPIPKLGFFSSSILVALCSLICYWSSVRGDFVFDDSEAIVNNRDVTGDASVSAIFSHDFWGDDISSNLSHKSYRPLTTLTFKLNYYLAEGLHPWGFHFVNVAVHTMVSVLFLFVFDIIFRTVDGCYGISFKMRSPRASLLTSLFFTAHPVHTESVSLTKLFFYLLQPFSPLIRRAWFGSSLQLFSMFLHILPFKSTIHVILGILLHLTTSTSYDIFLFLTQSTSFFHNTCPILISAGSVLRRHTACQSSPSASHLALYPVIECGAEGENGD